MNASLGSFQATFLEHGISFKMISFFPIVDLLAIYSTFFSCLQYKIMVWDQTRSPTVSCKGTC